MKKKFLSAIAICAILSSIAATYYSASSTRSSSWVDCSSMSSISISYFGSQLRRLISAIDNNQELNYPRKQNVFPTDICESLRVKNYDHNANNYKLSCYIERLQKRHPFMRPVKVVEGLYVVYDVYSKNSSENNFDFVKTFAKESANQLKSNVSCGDATNKRLFVVGQKAASLAGYVKRFNSAELFVLTNASWCPKTVKDVANA